MTYNRWGSCDTNTGSLDPEHSSLHHYAILPHRNHTNLQMVCCQFMVSNFGLLVLSLVPLLSLIFSFLSLLFFNDYSKICSLSLNFLLNTFSHSFFVDDYGSYFLKKTETIGHHLSQFLLPGPIYYLQTYSCSETACLPPVQRENYPHFY